MKPVVVLLVSSAFLSVSACGLGANDTDASEKELKSFVNVAGTAAKSVSELLDTKLVCQVAGQTESFCSCLKTELGPNLKSEHIDAITEIITISIDGAAESPENLEKAKSLDPDTVKAVVACGTSNGITHPDTGIISK